MAMVAAVKQLGKKSFAVHSAYKLVRDFRQIPKDRLTRFDALQDIMKVLPKTMLQMPRLFDLFDLVKQLNEQGVPGALVECGVWNGGAVGLMALANRRFPGPTRALHLFDSFEGLPQPTQGDEAAYTSYLEAFGPSAPTAGDKLTAVGIIKGESQLMVEDFLVRRLRIPRDELVFHVGWFQDTVPAARASIGDLALLRLDGDWYDSTKVCIENLYDKVVPRGFIVIDDYGTFEGCRNAIDEFFAARGIQPEFVYSDSDCVYFRKS
jgi:O-methyltransferase